MARGALIRAPLLVLGLGLFAQRSESAEPRTIPMAYTLRQLTTQQGLPQNTVRFLLLARSGYLWIATSAGLARYDGLDFKVYYNEYLASEGSDSRVWDLSEDGRGRIWVRTGNAVACFDHGQWSVNECNSAPINGVIAQSCGSQLGGIWLSMADGLRRFDHGAIVQNFTTTDGMAGDQASLAGEDTDGHLWLAFGLWTSKPVWQRLDPRTGKFNTLEAVVGPLEEVPEIVLPARSGGLWLLGSRETVRVLSQGQRVERPTLLTPDRRISHVTDDAFGTLWYLCDRIPRVFSYRLDQTPKSDLPELPSNDLRCLLPGVDGLVWVGAGDDGLLQLRPRLFLPSLTTNSSGQRMEVYSISPGSKGRVWFGTSDGLYCSADQKLTSFTNDYINPAHRTENSVRSVIEDHTGRVWFGVRNEGLKTLDGYRFLPVEGASCGGSNNWTVSSLLEDRLGNLWIGSELGLVRRSPSGTFDWISSKFGMLGGRVNGLQEGPDGAIWVGTDGGGIYRLEGDRASRFCKRDGLSSDYAMPLLVDSRGATWVGGPSGLNRIYQGKAATVTSEQGLPANEISGLLDDSNGFYWASCNRGVFRMLKSELNAAADKRLDWVSTTWFRDVDGLASTECNGECQPSVARTPDGRLWFSSTRGCSTVDANDIDNPETPPNVSIEEVLLDDQVIFKDGVLANSERRGGNGTPHFPAGRGRVLEVRYTAANFLNPSRVRFSHRLKGHDLKWRAAGIRRVGLYTDLRPGDYEFNVMACNEQGVCSPKLASFAFSLAPHFWQTWTFYSLSGLLVIGSLAAIQGYRLRWQHRLWKIEEQRSLANERARIARDLHDDLGTSLTGLALELDVIGRDSAHDRLHQTAGRAREMADRMREVVWSINPRCDNVFSLAGYLEQQVARFAGSNGMRIRLNFPDDIPTLPLGAEARHQLALSVREALTNVVRHSSASEVDVTLDLVDSNLLVEISDNGRGFRPGTTSGQGLTNMKGRMEQVGGVFECESTPGKGTKVRFRVPLIRGRTPEKP